MFGLGLPEILFILLVGAIILGPEHMPKAARLIGRWSAKMRSAATSFGQAVSGNPEVRELQSEIREVKTELDAAASEVRVAASDARASASEATDGVHGAYESARASLREFQATTGRAADDFMHRPLGRIAALEDSATEDVWLAPPRELSPEELSGILIIREHFTLPVPPDPGVPVALAGADCRRALCLVRVLPWPGRGVPGDLHSHAL